MTVFSRRQTLAGLVAGGATAFAHQAEAADALAKMTFLLVNDVYQLDENAQKRGGFQRLSTVVATERKRAEANGRRLVFVHAGDTLSPSLISSLEQGAEMIALFNLLKLDVFVPGNHEFDFGPDVYFKRMGEADFAVLAANLRDKDGEPLANHKDKLRLAVGGVTIDLIGSAYDATPAVSHSEALRFAPTPATIETAAAAARKDGADFVVAIIHADRAEGEALLRAHAADLILSGHNHDLHIDFDGRTALAESSQDAFYVTAIDIDIAVASKDGKRATSWWPDFRITDTADVIPDTGEILNMVRHYKARLGRSLNVPLAKLDEPWDSRREAVRSEETAIGDFVADALRDRTGADVTLFNGGGIRGDATYAAGTIITPRIILAELPFNNKLVVTEVSGQGIKAALENGLSSPGEPTGRFPQISGMKVEADAKAPQGARVKNVTIGAAPLDPQKTYKVATNDYMARGGDGYGMLAGKSKVTIDSGEDMVAKVVIDYAVKMKTIAVKPDGRLVLQR